jgi:hypothetical protein
MAVKSPFRGAARALPINVADERFVSPVMAPSVIAVRLDFRQLSEATRKTYARHVFFSP